MKAIILTEYGPSESLQLKDIAMPVPKENQVLVKVHVASVNPVDWHIMRGDPFFMRLIGFGLFKPKHNILGADFAGTVEAVGSSVTQFKVGDEVFGSGRGSFAEYFLINQGKLVHKPANLTFEQAAAVPVAGLTALQAIRVAGEVQPGDHVLVNGAAGGVGSFAVQFAKSSGAHVTGVCSGAKRETVLSIGADVVIDYTKDDYTRSDKKYDLIIDTANFGSIRHSVKALQPGGRYVLVGGSMANFLFMSAFRPFLSGGEGRKVAGMMANINQTDLLTIRSLLESGKVVPVISRRYTLSETPEAIRYVESGHALGKVVITVAP